MAARLVRGSPRPSPAPFPPDRTIASPRRQDVARPLGSKRSRRGARIAIDDFGTGHSALAYLKNLPCDLVKLERLRGLT